MRFDDAMEIGSDVAIGKIVTDKDMEDAIVALYNHIKQHRYPTGPINLEKVFEGVRKEIKDRREGAAYAGERGDGGASILEENLKWYMRGLERVFPEEWTRYALEADPEYQEYLRLQKKFDIKNR